MPNSALRIVYLLPLSLRYFWLGANTTPYKYKDWNRVFRQRPTGRTSTKLDAGSQPAEVRNSGPPPPEAAARAAPKAAIFGRNTRHLRTPAKTCPYPRPRSRPAQLPEPQPTDAIRASAGHPRRLAPALRPAPFSAARATHPIATVGRNTRRLRTPAKTCPGSPACPLLCGPRSSPNRKMPPKPNEAAARARSLLPRAPPAKRQKSPLRRKRTRNLFGSSVFLTYFCSALVGIRRHALTGLERWVSG